VFTSILAVTGAATTADTRSRTLGQLIVEDASGGPLGADTLSRLARVPGVAAVSAPGAIDVAVSLPYGVENTPASVVDLPTLARTHRIGATEGSLAALAPDSVAVSKEFAGWYGLHAGGELKYGRYGGEPMVARITAVLDAGAVIPELVLPMTTPGAEAAQQAVVLLDTPSASSTSSPASTTQTAAAELSAAATPGTTLKVTPTAQWFDGSTSEQDRLNHLVLVVLTGPAAAYALIAVAGTLVMAASRRRTELRTLRLVGVGRGKVLRMAAWEAVLTTLFGAGIAAAVVGAALASYRAALLKEYAVVPWEVPWGVLLGLVGLCLAVAVSVNVLATARNLRTEQRP